MRKWNKTSPEYYRRLSEDAFACVSCGEVHKTAWDAKRCCAAKKPRSAYLARKAEERRARQNPEPLPPPIKRRPKPPGEGIRYPDRDDNWYRGSEPGKKRKRDYYRAFQRIQSRARGEKRKRANFYAAFDRLFGESVPDNWTERLYSLARRRSPLQRLAYGYYIRNWEMVKQAAYDLAFDRVVREMVKRYHQTAIEAELVAQEFGVELPPDDMTVSQAILEVAGLPEDEPPEVSPEVTKQASLLINDLFKKGEL